jgi:hypothetical protein
VPWVETESLSFTARHESEQAEEAASVLEQLEGFRERLGELFDLTPGEVAVVIHPGPAQLYLAQPWLPLARMVAAPASRRYFSGCFSSREIHVLAPTVLRARASNVPGSREAIQLAPLHEYAHLVVGANNPRLPPPFNPGSFRRYLAWAWLCEGAATWLSGQARFLGPAIARRMHEGGKPSFPPNARDAMLLGGTVFGLLEREQGRRACVLLAADPDETSGTLAIQSAFGGHRSDIEPAWHRYLTELSTRAPQPTGRPTGRASSR